MNGNNSFSPNPVTVLVGQRVRWRNNDIRIHTATGSGFDTGNILPGATSTPVTFGTPGTVNYHCSIHPSMVGTLNVTN